MKELKSITEYQLFKLAYYSLLERVVHEERINKITKKDFGVDNPICQNRLKMYSEQLEEIRERILEIEHNIDLDIQVEEDE